MSSLSESPKIDQESEIKKDSIPIQRVSFERLSQDCFGKEAVSFIVDEAETNFRERTLFIYNYFLEESEHPRSQNLKINPYSEDEDSGSALYKSLEIEPYGYNGSNPELQSHIDNNLNIGWKLHLNVLPEDVMVVSSFLKKLNVSHKYFRGGNTPDGKVFTVYIGSYEKTKEVSKLLSDNIRDLLCKPMDHAEIEFNAGVVGRFCGPKVEYRQYGSIGLSYLGKLFYRNQNNVERLTGSFGFNARKKEIWQKETIASFIDKYGNYFFKDNLTN